MSRTPGFPPVESGDDRADAVDLVCNERRLLVLGRSRGQRAGSGVQGLPRCPSMRLRNVTSGLEHVPFFGTGHALNFFAPGAFPPTDRARSEPGDTGVRHPQNGAPALSCKLQHPISAGSVRPPAALAPATNQQRIYRRSARRRRTYLRLYGGGSRHPGRLALSEPIRDPVLPGACDTVGPRRTGSRLSPLTRLGRMTMAPPVGSRGRSTQPTRPERSCRCGTASWFAGILTDSASALTSHRLS